MKTIIAFLIGGITGATVVVLFLYLPAHTRGTGLEHELDEAQRELAATRSLLLVHSLYDQVSDLLDQVEDPAAYEEALRLSTQFFDLVREDASTSAETGKTFAAILQHRDAVTAALARRDPAVRGELRQIRAVFRPLLRPPDTANNTKVQP